MLTVGHEAAVQTALPLLFGRWTLKESRVPNTLWGRSKGVQGAPMDPVYVQFWFMCVGSIDRNQKTNAEYFPNNIHNKTGN